MTRHTLPPLDASAVDFFFEHAGYSHDPKRETPEEGRLKGARLLARAEAWLKSHDDLEIHWDTDWEGDHSYDGGENVETCELATLTNGNVDVLASLGCIDDATDDYRRVIEAQLALEAMPEALRCHHDADETAKLTVTCGTCGSTWCDECAGTHGPRCHWEAEHDDDDDDAVTDAERIAYTLTRLRRWEGNYQANAIAARNRGEHREALRLEIKVNDTADVIKMLDGTDDAHIAQLRKA